VNQDHLKNLPRTDRVLAHPRLAEIKIRLGTEATARLVRAAIQEAREKVMQCGPVPSEDEVAEQALRAARHWLARRTRRVINATGVVLHTNLGRAPLSEAAKLALSNEGSGYITLEVDLETGKRGGRAAFVEFALSVLCGGEAALVVNNNAAAVLLALAALASNAPPDQAWSTPGRPVLVSRGELVEIGGGFRVPEVLARSGARLVEVGTTNRTRVSDYAEALDRHPETAAILRVHPGNFRQIGFVERPRLSELVQLGHDRAVAVIEDLGGGALLSLEGLSGDPTVAQSVATGADLVTFSTDKILGGPQGGVLVGTKRAIEGARKDPLARALRLGRLPLVALEATLEAYLSENLDSIPGLAMTRRSKTDLKARAERWASSLGPNARVVELRSVTGGGTYPGEEIPSVGVALDVPHAEVLLTLLRTGNPAVLARVEEGVVVCDARTVLEGEDEALLGALRSALVRDHSPTSRR
jgi:L-seryl-tRNA(Ser) seleniumtransferase